MRVRPNASPRWRVALVWQHPGRLLSEVSNDGGQHFSRSLSFDHVGDVGEEPVQGGAGSAKESIHLAIVMNGRPIEQERAVQTAAQTAVQVVDPRQIIGVRSTP